MADEQQKRRLGPEHYIGSSASHDRRGGSTAFGAHLVHRQIDLMLQVIGEEAGIRLGLPGQLAAQLLQSPQTARRSVGKAEKVLRLPPAPAHVLLVRVRFGDALFVHQILEPQRFDGRTEVAGCGLVRDGRTAWPIRGRVRLGRRAHFAKSREYENVVVQLRLRGLVALRQFVLAIVVASAGRPIVGSCELLPIIVHAESVVVGAHSRLLAIIASAGGQ